VSGEVDVVQPVLWSMEVALATLWQDMGVEPDLCLGHSMGEAATAHVSGALSRRDSAAVICRRSQLMTRLAGRGAMVAVGLPAGEARRVVAEHGDPEQQKVCVAVENSPSSSVLAGDSELLDRIPPHCNRAGCSAGASTSTWPRTRRTWTDYAST
jgi:acyl transferase domain-containing protein